MTREVPRVDDRISLALDESGVPWTATPGRRHIKIAIGGKLVAVLPRSIRRSESLRYGAANALAGVRRAIRAYRGE